MTVLAIGSIVLIAIGIMAYLDVKNIGIEWNKKEKEDKEWLEKEMKNPKYAVYFELVDGKVLFGDTLDPYNTCPGSEWNFRYASEELAKRRMLLSYEKGYFTDVEGNTYPVCSISRAFVQRC